MRTRFWTELAIGANGRWAQLKFSLTTTAIIQLTKSYHKEWFTVCPWKSFTATCFCTQNHTSPRQKKWLHLVLLASSLAGKCSRWYTILHIILHIIIYYLPFLQLFMCYIFCFQCHLHFTIVFCHINKNFIQIFRWIYSCLSKTSGGWNLKWQHKSIEICQRCVNEDCSCLEEPSAMGPSSGQPPLWFKDLEPSKTSNVTKSNRTECPEDVSKTSEGGESEVRRH